MDFDPLSDAGPSRYAVESDEEDEYNPLQTGSSKSEEPVEFQIKVVGQSPKSRPLVVAFGDAGKYWAKGAELGEQTGAIMVNNVQVGLIFNPSWTEATIVVSETFTRLPVLAMADYASTLVDEVTPQRVTILDIYPASTYISPVAIPTHDAPIRYLSSQPVKDNTLALFEPPNLIHSTTSAALLSYLTTQQIKTQAALILLPFPRVPAPPPKDLKSSDFSHLTEDEYQWTLEMMNRAHKTLIGFATGQGTVSDWQKPKHSKPAAGAQASSRSTVGEGGMYI
ncbi:hypothetical protein VNI00_000057 [Paramarasmius palmivorus]|uniref:Proteasome assembly chaperone 1 n=1 Tax=Paramarasmius palmivorus TaxID=297713 RepID=A0AAW0EE78_9AGAR